MKPNKMKIFESHEKLKEYSAKRSDKFSQIYPEYTSTYFNIQ